MVGPLGLFQVMIDMIEGTKVVKVLNYTLYGSDAVARPEA